MKYPIENITCTLSKQYLEAIIKTTSFQVDSTKNVDFFLIENCIIKQRVRSSRLNIKAKL